MNAGISRFFNWLIVLLGVFQIISPFFLGITAFAGVVNGLVVGVLLIVLGVWAAVTGSAGTARTLDVIIAILGAWLIAAPLLLGYANLLGALPASPLLFGAIVLILAVLAIVLNRRDVAHVEQGAAVYGRGSDVAVAPTIHTDTEAANDTHPAPEPPAPAATATAEPPAAQSNVGDYQGADVTTQGSEAEEQKQPQGEFRGVGPQGYERSDDHILDDIVQRMTDEDQLDATNIHVSVQKGDVVLSGFVSTAVEKRMAGEIAEKVNGVQNVHNDLHVGSDAQSQTS